MSEEGASQDGCAAKHDEAACSGWRAATVSPYESKEASMYTLVMATKISNNSERDSLPERHIFEVYSYK